MHTRTAFYTFILNGDFYITFNTVSHNNCDKYKNPMCTNVYSQSTKHKRKQYSALSCCVYRL